MRKCLKCYHVNPLTPSGDSCPSCGAIYAKVEAAVREAQARPSARPTTAPSREAGRSTLGDQSRLPQQEPFVNVLRRESAYLTYRTVMRWMYGFVLLICAGTAIAGLFAEGTAVKLLSISTALLVALGATVVRDSVVMLADLSDATIRLAERADREDRHD